MAVQDIQDVTAEFNAGSGYTMDIGGFNIAVVQLVSPSGVVSFSTSNDGGAVAPVTEGNAVSALNFTAVTGTNLATATGVTSLNATGLVKFDGIGKYLRMSGTTVTATKVIVRLFKSV